jgi:ABC-type multidrug transport system fused ATPase/permease subunit
MNFFIQTLTELDNSLNHVARIVHYIENVPAEAAWDGPGDASLPKDWPSEGKIEFRDAVMTYREDLSPALKGLNANVGAHEKIGIAGRTGSGKSTLMLALFRMYELRSGSIWIDGVDIHTLGPHLPRLAHIVASPRGALWLPRRFRVE